MFYYTITFINTNNHITFHIYMLYHIIYNGLMTLVKVFLFQIKTYLTTRLTWPPIRCDGSCLYPCSFLLAVPRQRRTFWTNLRALLLHRHLIIIGGNYPVSRLWWVSAPSSSPSLDNELPFELTWGSFIKHGRLAFGKNYRRILSESVVRAFSHVSVFWFC